MSTGARIVLVVAALALLPASPAGAGVPVGECSFDAGNGVLTVTPAPAAVIYREGDGIKVDDDTCDGATVTTVDTIDVTVVTAGDDLEIRLNTGPFAPGKTDEGDGSSEIEFTMSGEAPDLMIRGTTGADHFAAAMGPAPAGLGIENAADFPAFDLNADEATPDIDVTLLTPGNTSIQLLPGDDTYSGAGIGDAPPIFFDVSGVTGGGGDDLIAPGYGGGLAGSIYVGSGGSDTFSFDWLPVGCLPVAIPTTTGSIVAAHGMTCDGAAQFAYAKFERFVGHAGSDWFGGDTGDDVVMTRGGDDRLFAGGGDDVLDGGPGHDIGIWTETGRVEADLRTGKALVGAWTQILIGLEDLIGSPNNDVLVGDGRDNRIGGEAGDDILRGKGGIDDLNGGGGVDACDIGLPGSGETVINCERH
jgi:Ca2+-binding RTX toxin-like protein